MPADVSELEELAADMGKAGARVRREQTKVVKETVDRIATHAQQNAPQGPTGDLRENIKPYAAGLRGAVVSGVRYAAFVEFGTYKDAPQPYLIPAAEANEAQYLADSEAAAERAMGF